MTSSESVEVPYGITSLRALVFFLDWLSNHSGNEGMIAGDLEAVGVDPKACPGIAADGAAWLAAVMPGISSDEEFAAFVELGFFTLSFIPVQARAHMVGVLEGLGGQIAEPKLLERLISELSKSAHESGPLVVPQSYVAVTPDTSFLRSLRRHLGLTGYPSGTTDGESAWSASALPSARRDGPVTSKDPEVVALQRLLQVAVAGQYAIERHLGGGGFGSVFLARQISLDRRVALKTIKPEKSEDTKFQKLFGKEARSIAKLEHPNILPIYQFGIADPIYWFSMRFIEGGSLEDATEKRSGRWEFDEAVTILRQVADALDFAHARSVIHRDVKPGNVLVDTAGKAFLTDFGIASTDQQSTTGTSDTRGWGSAEFMSPELFLGSLGSPATDQYALGVMAFFLLSGQIPFQGPRASLPYQHLNDTPRALSDLRPDLPATASSAIARALAKSPTERFGTCKEFVEAMVVGASRPERMRSTPSIARPPAKANPRSAPLRAEQPGVPPLPTWWLRHLAQISDYTVESGTRASTTTRTGRHQLLWQEATEWLGQVAKVVLDGPGERWINNPSQYQQGKLSGTYYGRLYPDSDPALKDAFHIGFQVSKKLKWVDETDPMYLDLVERAAGPIITVWASTNDNLIARLDRPELHTLDGELQHQIILHSPELWHEGGALVRARRGKKGVLMSPASYLEAADRGEIPPRCSIFGPLFTLQEVEEEPAEIARRIAGFLTLLADPVRRSREAAAQSNSL